MTVPHADSVRTTEIEARDLRAEAAMLPCLGSRQVASRLTVRRAAFAHVERVLSPHFTFRPDVVGYVTVVARDVRRQVVRAADDSPAFC